MGQTVQPGVEKAERGRACRSRAGSYSATRLRPPRSVDGEVSLLLIEQLVPFMK